MFGLVIAAFSLAFFSALVGALRAGHLTGIKRRKNIGHATETLPKVDNLKSLHSLSKIQIWADGGGGKDTIVDELRMSLLSRLEVDYRGCLFALDWVRERDKLLTTDDKLAIFLVGDDGASEGWESVSVSPNSSTGSSIGLLEHGPTMLASSAFIIVNCGVPSKCIEQLRFTLQAAGLWQAHPPFNAHTLDLPLLYHTISKFVINNL